MAKLSTTAGQLLLRSAIPEDIYDPSLVLDKAGVSKLLRLVGEKHPDKYVEVSKRLMDVGFLAAERSGGYSFGVNDLLKAKSATTIQDALRKRIAMALDDDSLDDKQRERRLLKEIDNAMQHQTDAVYDESLAEGNPLALQLKGAGRGNKTNLSSLRGSDLLYVDSKGSPVPVPILRSYSQGLQPSEYFAGSFGARQGTISTKLATADAGYLSKVIHQISHKLIVTKDDNDQPYDTIRGFPVDVNDDESEGSLLAVDTGGYKRNTTLTPKILRELEQQGIKRLLVRSPAVGSADDDGLLARDVGVREYGRTPRLGEMVGLVAAAALSEPLSQAQLCLAADTMVRMADGTVKMICQVQVGDLVVGFDRMTNATVFTTVTNVFSNGHKPLTRHRLVIDNDSEKIIDLDCTDDHKVYGWLPDSHLTLFPIRLAGVGTEFRNIDTGGLCSFYDRVFLGEHATYDIEVSHPDHLFVLANGLVVSNSSKHSGGVAGASASKAVFGFPAINQLIHIPKTFKGGATHTESDGFVGHIDPAPAGGHFVHVDSQKYYVPEGFDLKVKRGDRVEAGDILSEGLPNPAIVVRHKGIGEGRRYFTSIFRDTLRNAGIKGHRRNVELLSRGLINNVRVHGEVGGAMPDDIVPYSTIERNWEPREGYQDVEPKAAVGKYLEKPYLHYSIGTKIRPSMLPNFQDFNVGKIAVHNDPPPFDAEMVRGADTLSNDPDWQTKMLGSGLKRGLLKSVHRGATSDQEGLSYVPSAAQGVNFGSVGPFKLQQRKSVLLP